LGLLIHLHLAGGWYGCGYSDSGCSFYDFGGRRECCRAETTSCPANQWLNKVHVANTMTDNQCVPTTTCGMGTRYRYHTEKANECPPCPANQYQGQAGHRLVDCVGHQACGPGQRLVGASAIIGPGTCTPCPAGQFRSDASHFEPVCIPHKECAATQNKQANGTVTTDTQCAENRECTAGEFEVSAPQAGETNRVCEALTTCEAGRYVESKHNKTTDRTCGYCDGETYYTDQPNLPSCKEFGFCSFGERVATAGTAASDLVCGNCNSTNDEYQSAALANASRSSHRATACQVPSALPTGNPVRPSPTTLDYPLIPMQRGAR